jgi:hypothetical protein
MTTLNKAVTDAQQTLAPMIQSAIKAEQTRQANAEQQLSREQASGALVQAIKHAKAKDQHDAAAVIQQYCTMLPQDRITDGDQLIIMLPGIRATNRINDSQAQKIGQALMLAAAGGVDVGLIEFRDRWPDAMSTQQLHQLADLVCPDAAAALQVQFNTAAADLAAATYELKRLHDLAATVVELGRVKPYSLKADGVKVRTDKRVGISGHEPLLPGVTLLAPQTLAALFQHQGFRNGLQNGSIEVVQ